LSVGHTVLSFLIDHTAHVTVIVNNQAQFGFDKKHISILRPVNHITLPLQTSKTPPDGVFMLFEDRRDMLTVNEQ
jgi:hypothetical protein